MNFNDMKLTTENTENTEQDTPETDEVRRATDCNALGYGLMTLHACKLECERDEAREELRTAVQERHDFHWELQDAIRDRNEARELLSAAQNALDVIHLEVGSWIEKLKESK
jgi:hypothetical protein